MNENETAEKTVDEEVSDVSNILEHTDSEFKGTYETMLTTNDNPFDPFDQFDDWFNFDERQGYHTCSYLGRIARISDEMSDEEVSKEMNRAVDEILKNDFAGIYKKVRRVPEEIE